MLTGTGHGGWAASLYTGLTPLLLRDLPFNAVDFGVYEQLKLSFVKTCRYGGVGRFINPKP